MTDRPWYLPRRGGFFHRTYELSSAPPSAKIRTSFRFVGTRRISRFPAPSRAHGICLLPFPCPRRSHPFAVPGLLLRFSAFVSLICIGSPTCFRFIPTHRITPALRFTLTPRRTFPFRLCSRHSLRLPAQARRARRNSAFSLWENFLPGVRLFPVPSPFIPIRQ